VSFNIQHFFHEDDISFSIDNALWGTRSYDSFSEVADEVIEARIWGGIHTRTADVQGARLGRHVAKYVREHYFRPLG